MADKEALTFSRFVEQHEEGALHRDLTDAVNEIVADLNNAVLDKGGTHVAALDLKLAFKIDSGMIEVKAVVKKTLPKQSRPKSIYFATEDNDLTRKNPRQPDLPFRDVNSPRQEPRAIG